MVYSAPNAKKSVFTEMCLTATNVFNSNEFLYSQSNSIA